MGYQTDSGTDASIEERHVRALFVSDVHLGCRYAQPERFLAYLQRVRPEQLYILGDFVDGWKLRSSWRWTPVYTRIIRRLVHLMHGGTEILYTPGNHDAFLRCFDLRYIVESTGLNLRVDDEFIHHTLDGRRFLVTHGDKFDVIEMRYRWLSEATSLIYDPLLFCNWWYSRLFLDSHRSPYALCAIVKDLVKRGVKFLSAFEQALFAHARSRKCDGVVCGHIHSPCIRSEQDMVYLNIGDWVEHCTALVEEHDGVIRIESYYEGVTHREAPRVEGLATAIQPLPTDLSTLDDAIVAAS